MVTKRGLRKDADLPRKIDSAIIPGLQGGPHNHTTAAIAVALKEAASKQFTVYSRQIVKNAQVLAKELIKSGFELVSGGTDNHLILVDLRNKGVNGWVAGWALEYAGIILNRNGVPGDTNPPFYPSGIRMGTPALTSRSMKEREMKRIARWINDVVEHVKNYQFPVDSDQRKVFTKKFLNEIRKDKYLARLRREVARFAHGYPVPGITDRR